MKSKGSCGVLLPSVLDADGLKLCEGLFPHGEPQSTHSEHRDGPCLELSVGTPVVLVTMESSVTSNLAGQ